MLKKTETAEFIIPPRLRVGGLKRSDLKLHTSQNTSEHW